MQALLDTRLKSTLEISNDVIRWFNSDPRHYQISFLTLFLFYGIGVLGWEVSAGRIAFTFIACFATQFIFSYLTHKDYHSLKSAAISALSLTLMLKATLIWVIAIACVLSIACKFIFTEKILTFLSGLFTHRNRYIALTESGKRKSKHFFNPTNFGIVTTILLTGQAWISPGQWGSSALLVFAIGILGFAVLVRVKRLDTAFAFFLTFCALSYIRSVWVLGWEIDFFLHQFTSGTLLLFTFFMITDPVSTPSHPVARIIWATLVGLLAFFLATYEFLNGAPIWALFILSPTTLLFDKLFVHTKFSWK